MSDTLVGHIVAWLQQVVPGEIKVSSVAPGSVLIRSSEGPEVVVQDVKAVLEEPGAAASDAIVAALDSLLSTVQDFVCETLTVPWPVATSDSFPMPRVVVSPAETVVAGFATPHGWVLRTPPFRFDGSLA